MVKKNVIPALADVTQDIAGHPPVALIQAWLQTDRTTEAQARILEPHQHTGTLVCSDAAGLSKLSQAKTLMEVMQLVHQPKAIIHKYGVAIGGKPVGVWAADNTSMFYPASIPAEKIVAAMLAAQKEIQETCTVQVGMGAHHGTMYLLAGGAFGADAEYIEQHTEENTSAGEIFLSETMKKLCPNPESCQLLPKIPAATSRYPAAFPEDFYDFLDAAQAGEQMMARYGKESVVVFLSIKHQHQPLLLNMLTEQLAATAQVQRLARGYPPVTLVKTTGTLAIALADSVDTAVQFAQSAIQDLAEQGYQASAGVARGEVLLFPLAHGMDIAGAPVNLASKLSEDTGEAGEIAVEAACAEEVGDDWQEFAVEISGVSVKGKKKTL